LLAPSRNLLNIVEPFDLQCFDIKKNRTSLDPVCAVYFSYFVNYNDVLHLLIAKLTDFPWKCKFYFARQLKSSGL